ncbi:PorT family protein [Neolewinella aurantiaca]|uniref:PorT family protein n=1 Tax=Neolewinella aurantiaca TaxID=2602767 RepID=A0A5C7FLQ7_9BACT|nr:porin family protein [Neolewinella aurantiaca]TXF91640.1 PorT family protein [Neolewinella aurantiaca]
MRILSILFFALACTLGSLSAQSIGLRAGANSSSLKFESDGISITYDAKVKLMFGAFFDLPVADRLLLSPEVSYLGRGYKYSEDFFGPDLDSEATINYIDLGVLAKYQLVDNESIGVYIGAGPVLGYALSGTSEFGGVKEDIEFDDEDGFNRTYLSLAGVGGVTFAKNFFVEARYMLGLSSLNEEEGNDVKAKWNSIGINAGVRLPIGQ